MLRSLFSFDRALFEPGQATRCAIGFSTPVVVSMLIGHAGWGVLAGLGALYAGLASFTGIYYARLRVMLTTSFMMAAVTMLGGLVSRHPGEAIVSAGIVALVLGSFASTSPAASTIAVQGTAILVVIAGIPSTSDNPLGNALLVLGGGLFQTLLLTVVWPVFPHLPEREAVANVFDTLARYVASIGNGEAPPIPNSSPFQKAWDLMDQTERYASKPEHAVLRQALQSAEAARAALVGLTRSHAALVGETPDTHATEVALAARMTEIADAIRRGSPIGTGPDESGTPLEFGEAESSADYARWISLLWEILAQAGQAPSEGVAASEVKRSSKPAWRLAVDRLLTLIDSASIRILAGRSAVRYAASVAFAVGMSHAWGISHAYWLPLTVCIVLRADYATTVERGASRLAGTLLGAGMATVLAYLLHPSPIALVAMMLVGGWFTCALLLSGYTYYSAAITIYVVASVASSGLSQQRAGAERIEATLAGVALAILANLAWPTWQSPQVKGILRDAVQAQMAYGAAVTAMLEGRQDHLDEDVRRRARTLRLEAERIVAAAKQEPRWGRACLPPESSDILARLDENAALMLSLHAEALQESLRSEPIAADALPRARSFLKRAQALEESLGGEV